MFSTSLPKDLTFRSGTCTSSTESLYECVNSFVEQFLKFNHNDMELPTPVFISPSPQTPNPTLS